MGNAGCSRTKSSYKTYKKKSSTNQLSFAFTLIWLDDERKKNSELKYYLKQMDQELIRFDNSDLCETYIRERLNDHFILIVCHKLGNILVPEIDDLSQLDSVFVYDFSSNVVYRLWMEKCKKVT
jgi:hypothetical protein